MQLMVDAQTSANKEDANSQEGRERSQMEELKFMVFSVVVAEGSLSRY